MESLTSSVCHSVVEKYLKTKQFEIVSKELMPLVDIAGYMAIPNVFIIKVQEANKEDLTTVSLFVKEVPKNPFHLELVKQMGAFYKEAQIYERVLSKFEEYTNGKIWPEFYYSNSDHVLVLEDLTKKGFENKKNDETYDEAHCRISLNAIAKFHAASIAYEEKNSVQINKIAADLLYETLFENDPEHYGFKFLLSSIETLEGILEVYFPHSSPEVTKKAYDMLRRVPHNIKASNTRRNVLTHGDLWNNNIMFKYNDNGAPEDIKIIDFQLARYAAPAFDMLLFLLVTTEKQFRKVNFEALLLYYYDQLNNALAWNNIDINNIFSWHEFRASVEEELPTALAIAFAYLHYTMLPKEIAQTALADPKLYQNHVERDRRAIVLKVMKSNPKYRKRVLDAITDLLHYASNHQ